MAKGSVGQSFQKYGYMGWKTSPEERVVVGSSLNRRRGKLKVDQSRPRKERPDQWSWLDKMKEEAV